MVRSIPSGSLGEQIACLLKTRRYGKRSWGLWQISTDPLIFTIHSGKIFIRDSRKDAAKYPPVLDLPVSVFMALSPKEIIEQIDKKNDTHTLRTDFSGFNRSPFSSQN